eukprot:364183-Chlamydomonas_euryale.AAC.26
MRCSDTVWEPTPWLHSVGADAAAATDQKYPTTATADSTADRTSARLTAGRLSMSVRSADACGWAHAHSIP